MTTRKRLPFRRECETIAFELSGHGYKANVGRHSDGELAEIFLVGWKTGSDMEAILRDACIIASKAFQRGMGLDEIRKSITREPNGRASSPVGKILDLLAADERAARKAGEANNA